MNFPKRDELSLRTVRAFPNASRIGFDSRTGEKKEVENVVSVKMFANSRIAQEGEIAQCYSLRSSIKAPAFHDIALEVRIDDCRRAPLGSERPGLAARRRLACSALR